MRWNRRERKLTGIAAVSILALLAGITFTHPFKKLTKTRPFEAETYEGTIISFDDYPEEYMDQARKMVSPQIRQNPNSTPRIFKTEDDRYFFFIDETNRYFEGEATVLTRLNHPDDGRQIADNLARTTDIDRNSPLYLTMKESLQRIRANNELMGENSYLAQNLKFCDMMVIDISPEYFGIQNTRSSNHPAIFQGLIADLE